MISALRRFFSPDLSKLDERMTRLEGDLREWEVTMSGLTDKMSSQLKRLAARSGARPMDEAARQAEVNEAIRLRRRSRAFPLTNGDG